MLPPHTCRLPCECSGFFDASAPDVGDGELRCVFTACDAFFRKSCGNGVATDVEKLLAEDSQANAIMKADGESAGSSKRELFSYPRNGDHAGYDDASRKPAERGSQAMNLSDRNLPSQEFAVRLRSVRTVGVEGVLEDGEEGEEQDDYDDEEEGEEQDDEEEDEETDDEDEDDEETDDDEEDEETDDDDGEDEAGGAAGSG